MGLKFEIAYNYFTIQQAQTSPVLEFYRKAQ